MDKENIIVKANDTDKDYEYNVTMQELFQRQVDKTPDATALLFGGETLTYRELDRASNALAWKLRERGVKNNDIVILMAERSFEMLIGIYGIIKAGGAYLPISSEYPKGRIRYIIKESECRHVVSDNEQMKELTDTLNYYDLKDFGLYNGKDSRLPLVNTGESLVYVIYTSGSTGNPKGVMIKHSALVNRILWMQDKYPIDTSDTLIQKTTFTFDVSVWEMFWWAITGARLLIMKPMMEKFPQALLQDISDYGVTVIHFVPSMLDVFLLYVSSSGEVNRLHSLKKVFCSGEKLTANQVKKCNEILYRENGTTLTNLYGPTEASIDVTYYDCETEGDFSDIPIGKPIYNTKLFIVNEKNELAAVGEKGEIYIGGAGLSNGYLNRLDLTEEMFVRTEFLSNALLYKTGDIGRWLPDGNIAYIGRKDNQVKIRGLRIELSEIERVVETYAVSIKCIVVTNEVNSSNILINAFVVAENEVDSRELKEYLKQHLLPYMIPNNIVFIKEIPMNANGKADRRKLSTIVVRNNKILQGVLNGQEI